MDNTQDLEPTNVQHETSPPLQGRIDHHQTMKMAAGIALMNAWNWVVDWTFKVITPILFTFLSRYLSIGIFWFGIIMRWLSKLTKDWGHQQIKAQLA